MCIRDSDDTAEKVDEIAERILMLGGTPANKFSDYLKAVSYTHLDVYKRQR